MSDASPRPLLEPLVVEFEPLPRAELSWEQIVLFGGEVIVLLPLVGYPGWGIYQALQNPFAESPVDTDLLWKWLVFLSVAGIYLLGTIVIIHSTYSALRKHAVRRRNRTYRAGYAGYIRETLSDMVGRSFRLMELHMTEAGNFVVCIHDKTAAGMPYRPGTLERWQVEWHEASGYSFLRFSRPHFVPFDFREMEEDRPVYAVFEWGSTCILEVPSLSDPLSWPSRGFFDRSARDSRAVQ